MNHSRGWRQEQDARMRARRRCLLLLFASGVVVAYLVTECALSIYRWLA